MAEGMAGGRLGQAGPADGLFDGALHHGFVEVVPAALEDEALDPGDVRILCSPAVVAGADRVAHAIEKLGLRLGWGLARFVHARPPFVQVHPMGMRL